MPNPFPRLYTSAAYSPGGLVYEVQDSRGRPLQNDSSSGSPVEVSQGSVQLVFGQAAYGQQVDLRSVKVRLGSIGVLKFSR